MIDKLNMIKCVPNEEKIHSLWVGILERCRRIRPDCRNYAYLDCSICEEWRKNYNAFSEWAKRQFYIQGYQIDKDILCKGNKEYAPDKCCFVPMFINSLFTKSNKSRGKYPIGVSVTKCGRFAAHIRKKVNGERLRFYLGSYNNAEDAFIAYKTEREKYIKEVADEYKDYLDPKVYQAMYNYKVEIDD